MSADLEQFIYDALIDLDGYYPSQLAERLAERLIAAGFISLAAPPVVAALEATLLAHRPYGLDCKCDRPINSDADWARHVVGVLGEDTER